LVPAEITAAQASIIYAEEADVLNVAMFGMTANINAVLINAGVPQGERLVKLNQIAIQQMQVLEGNEGRNLLK
jgi:hypothetical protein